MAPTTDAVWGTVVFKDGKKLVIKSPGNAVLQADGIMYAIHHAEGIALFNAEQVLYLTQQRTTAKAKLPTARARGLDEGEY